MGRSAKGWLAGGLVGVVAAGGLAALYATSLAREQVQLDRYTVHITKPSFPRSGLTILHLTDFHFRAGGAVQERKLAQLHRLLAGESYDLVALTGDLIHDTAGLPKALELIRSLDARCGLYFVPGNHDYAEYTPWGVLGHTWRESAEGGSRFTDVKHIARALADFVRKVVKNELVRMPVCFNDVPAMIAELEVAGVRSLVNASMRLPVDGGEVWLAGIDDEMESHPDLAQAFDGVPEGAPLILLAHNPDIWLQCGVDRADLVLSGHTHGGQIQLPIMGAVHTQGTHLSRKAPAGWFERGHSKMFVGRGLGESIPLRFGARPQVALITLLPGRESAPSITRSAWDRRRAACRPGRRPPAMRGSGARAVWAGPGGVRPGSGRRPGGGRLARRRSSGRSRRTCTCRRSPARAACQTGRQVFL